MDLAPSFVFVVLIVQGHKERRSRVRSSGWARIIKVAHCFAPDNSCCRHVYNFMCVYVLGLPLISFHIYFQHSPIFCKDVFVAINTTVILYSLFTFLSLPSLFPWHLPVRRYSHELISSNRETLWGDWAWNRRPVPTRFGQEMTRRLMKNIWGGKVLEEIPTNRVRMWSVPWIPLVFLQEWQTYRDIKIFATVQCFPCSFFSVLAPALYSFYNTQIPPPQGILGTCLLQKRLWDVYARVYCFLLDGYISAVFARLSKLSYPNHMSFLTVRIRCLGSPFTFHCHRSIVFAWDASCGLCPSYCSKLNDQNLLLWGFLILVTHF